MQLYLEKSKILHILGGQNPYVSVPPILYKAKPGSSPKLVNAVWSYVSTKKKSVVRLVGYTQTHASAGLVVNHCAAAVASKGSSCEARQTQ